MADQDHIEDEHLEPTVPPATMRHPSGLWVLFITEMWERFSYYGMRAILVLYLIAGTAEVLENGAPNTNPGFGWTKADAYLLYGVYTFMVYVTAIFGGALADRVLGTHRSMLVGGWAIAAGHITLACTEFFDITPGTVVTFQNSPGAVVSFMIGLALIIVGTGFFKPCVSVMVGQLYEEGDARRDSGFTIFYMGINLGAFFSPLVAGTLGEKVGWHWGFGSAAVGMITGLLFYQFIRPRYLGRIGLPPEGRGGSRRALVTGLALAAAIVAVPVLPLVLFIGGGLGPIIKTWAWLTETPTKQTMLVAVVATVIIGAILVFTFAQKQRERAPLGVIFILAFVGNIFFWTAFEQAGSTLNVFAAQETDRTLWGLWGLLKGYWFPPLSQPINAVCILLFAAASAWLWIWLRRRGMKPSTPLKFSLGLWLLALAFIVLAQDTNRTLWGVLEGDGFPATWYQSVNPLCILLFAPVFAWLWLWLDRRRINPSTPLKFSLGLWLLGLAFIAMIFGALDARSGLAAPYWLLITYVVCTWGELCLSPVGLSMVTKLAPPRLQSFMMGVWFFTFALSNLCAGLVARFSTKFLPDSETGAPSEMEFLGIEGLPGFFLMLVIFPIGAAVVILLMARMLKRMMHGVD